MTASSNSVGPIVTRLTTKFGDPKTSVSQDTYVSNQNISRELLLDLPVLVTDTYSDEVKRSRNVPEKQECSVLLTLIGRGP
jgi:hypothetical protein